jgi:hypothetical protein
VATNNPIAPRVRLAISLWPYDAPRGAVSTFCAEHDISRKSVYELRERVKTEGPAAVLEPRSRRPRSSPSKLTDQVKEQAVQVRAALEASGLDHGPISVHDKMQAMGLDPVPSTASLARIFREAGVAHHVDQTSEHRRHHPRRQGDLHGRRESPVRAGPRRTPPTPKPGSPTSATDDPQEPARRTPKCHQSPDTPTVTDVLIQDTDTAHISHYPEEPALTRGGPAPFTAYGR